jgi:hypothetical protein
MRGEGLDLRCLFFDMYIAICYHLIKSVITGGNMVRTQIQLTEEQVKGLKRIAASRHLSVAELIRRSVDAILKTSTLVDSEERYKRAKETAGRFRSGKRDISRKHDRYLEEAFGK